MRQLAAAALDFMHSIVARPEDILKDEREPLVLWRVARQQELELVEQWAVDALQWLVRRPVRAVHIYIHDIHDTRITDDATERVK